MDGKTPESLVDLITEARTNVLAEEEEEKKKKEGKKPSIADGITKTTKMFDVWTPMNVFRFGLAALLVSVKLGLTSSTALANVSWWLVLLPAYALEGIMVAALLALGLLALLYVAALGFWTAAHILIFDPIRRRRASKKIDEYASMLNPPDSKIDVLAEIRQAMMDRDQKESH